MSLTSFYIIDKVVISMNVKFFQNFYMKIFTFPENMRRYLENTNFLSVF